MNSDKLSIIVPVYNNEQFLGKCVQSIMQQTHTNLEIILVDDGSTDSSGMICDKYARIDRRITVIHKKNKGVVCARNTGIENATGKYITFVDSDDWIEPNMYEFLLSAMGDCDLVTSGYYINYTENSAYKSVTDLVPARIYRAKDELEFFYSNMIFCGSQFRGMMVNVVNKIFRRDFVLNMYTKLPTNLRYEEDIMFSYLYTLQCNAISVTHDVFYHYRMNEKSAMHRVYHSFLSDVQDFYWHMKQAFAGHFCENKLIHQLQRLVNRQLLYQADDFLGFSEENKFLAYIYPFGNMLQNLKIVLYGAGKVGANYYTYITNTACADIVLWVDTNHTKYVAKGLPVNSIETMMATDFDFIVIAVKDKSAVDSITQELMRIYNIPKEKILWQPPKELFDMVMNNTTAQMIRGGVLTRDRNTLIFPAHCYYAIFPQREVA